MKLWLFAILAIETYVLYVPVKGDCEVGMFGRQCQLHCHCKGLCNDESGRCGGECHENWSGRTCQKFNAAFNKSADQSSTYISTHGTNPQTVSNAIDGNTSGDFLGNGTCMHTLINLDDVSWWRVDLEYSRAIIAVRIYDRINIHDQQRMARYQIFVSNSTIIPSGNRCFVRTDPLPEEPELRVYDQKCPVTGRYVIIYLQKHEAILNFCEVEIYVCGGGTYGPDCEEECGQCIDGNTCDSDDGTCHRGCSPGWNGRTCTKECQNGTYGQDCSNKCGYCVNGCNTVNGDCNDGCIGDYVPPLCQLLPVQSMYNETTTIQYNETTIVLNNETTIKQTVDAANGVLILALTLGFFAFLMFMILIIVVAVKRVRKRSSHNTERVYFKKETSLRRPDEKANTDDGDLLDTQIQILERKKLQLEKEAKKRQLEREIAELESKYRTK